FFVRAEDGIRDFHVTGVQTCALPISGLVTTVGGRRVAQITLVVGTGTEPGGDHASWQPNLAFAQELAAALNRQAPGVFNRILRVPNRRYNQELHPNTILVELGSYHNTD